MKSVCAFSLPTVLVISILMCLLCLFAVSLFDFNNLYYSYYQQSNRLRDNLHSIFVLYANDSTWIDEVEEKGIFRLYEDDVRTDFKVAADDWGLYECVRVRALSDSCSAVRLFGKVSDCDYEAALWVCNGSRSLSLGGTAEVKGNVYVPLGMVDYLATDDWTFQGERIKGSYINPAMERLPEVASTPLELKKRYAGEVEELPSVEQLEERACYSFWEEEAHFYVPDDYTVFSLRGKVVLHGDRVTLGAESTLEDVIVMARSVYVEEGFKGSLQIIATDSVLVGREAHLRYPSGVYLEAEEEEPYLQLGRHSTLDGYAIVRGKRKGMAASAPNVNFRMEGDAVFNGLLYVDGMADLQGSCYGGVYVKECCYTANGEVYNSVLCDARIYRNVQMGFPIFFRQSGYMRREMKMLY